MVELFSLTCCPLILLNFIYGCSTSIPNNMLYFIYGCITCILDNITRWFSVTFMSSSPSTVSSPTAKLRGTSSCGRNRIKNPRSSSNLSGLEPFPMPLCCPINPTVPTESELLPKIWGTLYTSGKAKPRHTINKWTFICHLRNMPNKLQNEIVPLWPA